VKALVAQQGAGMAVDAPCLGAKQVHAPQLLVAQTAAVTGKKTVERGGCFERPQEGDQGIVQMRLRDWPVAVDGSERLAIFAVACKPLQDVVGCLDAHFCRVGHRIAQLRGQAVCSAVPTQTITMHHVVQGRRVAPALRAMVADRARQPIAPAQFRVVAALAGNLAGG
jgi:hypothetical protein